MKSGQSTRAGLQPGSVPIRVEPLRVPAPPSPNRDPAPEPAPTPEREREKEPASV